MLVRGFQGLREAAHHDEHLLVMISNLSRSPGNRPVFCSLLACCVLGIYALIIGLGRKEYKPMIPRGLTWEQHRAVWKRAIKRYKQGWADILRDTPLGRLSQPPKPTAASTDVVKDLGASARDIFGKYYQPQTKEGIREAVGEVCSAREKRVAHLTYAHFDDSLCIRSILRCVRGVFVCVCVRVCV